MKPRRFLLPLAVLALTLAALPVYRARAVQASAVGQGGRWVAKEALLNLRVANADQALLQLEQIAARFGGQITGRQTWTFDDQGRLFKAAALTVRVPAASFEPALLAARALAVEVLDETVSGADRTNEITDTESRVRAMQTEQQRLSALAGQVSEGAEAQRIREQLLEVEIELSQLTGELSRLRENVAWSTISLELSPVIPTLAPTLTPTPAPSKGPTPTANPTAWRPERTYRRAVSMREQTLPFAGMCGIPLLILAFILIVAIRPGKGGRKNK